MVLNSELCAFARAQAVRELEQREPESIVLYIWNSKHGEALPTGIVSSRAVLRSDEDSPEDAMNTILGDAPDGRHLLGWNKFYRSQTEIGVGYTADLNGESGCYVLLSATPEMVGSLGKLDG